MAHLKSSAPDSSAGTRKDGGSTAVRPRANLAPASGATKKRGFGGVVLAQEAPPSFSNVAVYRASPLERIDMIRRGILASEAKRLFEHLPIGQGAGFKALNLSTATVNKKAKDGATLSPEESERVIGLAKLLGQLEMMVQDSGEPANFDAPTWMARWLTEPLPAFGGARPAEFLDTMEGQGLVSGVLAKMQSGTYA